MESFIRTDRYDSYRAILGNDFVKKASEANILLIGAGALGN